VYAKSMETGLFHTRPIRTRFEASWSNNGFVYVYM